MNESELQGFSPDSGKSFPEGACNRLRWVRKKAVKQWFGWGVSGVSKAESAGIFLTSSRFSEGICYAFRKEIVGRGGSA